MESARKLQLKKIFDFCLNNNLFFNLSPHVQSVRIHSGDNRIKLMSYYNGELYGYQDEYSVHIEKVIDSLKNQIKEFKQSNGN